MSVSEGFPTYFFHIGPIVPTFPLTQGNWGKKPFIFRELGNTSSYFQGPGEEAVYFRSLGALSEYGFLFCFWLLGGSAPSPLFIHINITVPFNSFS